MSDIVEQLRQGSVNSDDYRWIAAEEITRLRAENGQLLEDNFHLAAWQCVYTDGKTGLVAHEHGGTYCAMATKVEQLLYVLADTRTDNMRLREWNAEIALNGRELVAENERLRAALEQLLACPAIADGNHGDPAWACHETAAAETFARKVLARAALEGRT